jgi:hypothetical protein
MLLDQKRDIKRGRLRFRISLAGAARLASEAGTDKRIPHLSVRQYSSRRAVLGVKLQYD